MALALETHPVIKARPRLIIGRAHVPLADEAGGVTGLLEILWKEQGSLGHQPLVVNHAVAKSIETGENGGATGRTE